MRAGERVEGGAGGGRAGGGGAGAGGGGECGRVCRRVVGGGGGGGVGGVARARVVRIGVGCWGVVAGGVRAVARSGLVARVVAVRCSAMTGGRWGRVQ